MITYNKIFVPAAVYLAVLAHVVMLFSQFGIASPEELQEAEPEFKYIEAVMIETPQPEPVAIEEPEIIEPPPEPEPIVEIPEPVNEAVEIGEESEELDRSEEPPSIIQEKRVATSPSPQAPSAATVAAEPEGTVNVQPEAENVFIPFYKVEKRPEFLDQAPLQYPIQAKRERVEGVVIIEADIDEKGKIIDTRVVKKVGFGFEEAAINMLKASVFSPAIIDGRPVAVRMRFTLEFKLN
ncbi:MAG: energy transducer TonB [Spirochaetales bacterium]|jgi:periplasmic protein TonB|nr:energy transducer TonB [Spirochaetales bacterium]